MALSCMLGLSFLPLAQAKPPESAQIEIDYLLGFIEDSGCQFFRNGSWYDSKKAQAHLRNKYEALVSRGLIKTAEDFIDLGASQSSISGKPYEIQCGEGKPVTTGPWLHDVLVRYRVVAAQKTKAP
jgi:hypothetical protein